MNLVKWLRKNRTKVMAVVVVVLMVAFIGGSALSYLLSPHRASCRKAVAYVGNNRKIINPDLSLASQELEILQLLGADDLLRAQDLHGFFLAELLFSEGRPSISLLNQLKQAIRSNRLGISDRQINDVYKRNMPANIYWFLLKNEAQLAGIRVTNNEVGELLGRAIPQLFNGRTYVQQIRMMVERYGIPEARILEIFGQLLAVLQYANLICSTEGVTVSQVRWLASCESETIDVEFIKFDPAMFVGDREPPSEEQIIDHFNKYKETFAGEVSQENPYGFGYKLPDRVQLEWIAVKLNDISPTVTSPTPQETEGYYRQHIKQFTESVPQDPNDPNSPLVERPRSYAEMESFISKQLLQDKINSKVESILQEAKTVTEANLQDVDTKSLSAEQRKSATGDYKETADKLAVKYEVNIYKGQTGQLSGADIDADEYLKRFYMLGQGRNPVKLRQIVFSVEELQEGQVTSPGPLDMPRPKLFENIGPVRDLLGELMLLVRVTWAEKASAPASIDQTFSKQKFDLVEKQTSEPEKADNQMVYSIKGKITDDLKKYAIIHNGFLRSKAEEFITLVGKDDWEKTIGKFNELYGKASVKPAVIESKQNAGDPNVIKVEKLANLRRIPREVLTALEIQSEGRMGEQMFVREVQKWLSVNEARIQSRFIEQLYSLVPQNSSTVSKLPLLLEFQPEMSFYVIKNILVKRLGSDEFEKNRIKTFFKEEQLQSQSLAPVYFNPDNILKRMNFKLVNQQNKTESESEDKG